jgi:hypothetical protein
VIAALVVHLLVVHLADGLSGAMKAATADSKSP